MSPISEDLEVFRQQVRSFLAENLSPATARRSKSGYYLAKNEVWDWQNALSRKGWSVRNWPVEYGGTGWSLLQKHIFDEECARAGAPVIPGAGINMVGSLLLNFGAPEQKERFLPGIRSGESVWCQGWSEAQAGSDLANLRCKAVRDGDHYVVNGTKLWTSNAQHADMCMLLVRTSTIGRKQDGITILLVDLKTTPGITIRPIYTINGKHGTNEVHFDEVRAPVANRVGEEGRGWPMMRGIVLDHERISAAGITRAQASLERIHEVARTDLGDGTTLMENGAFRRRLAWLELKTRALHARLLEILATPSENWGTMPSVLKLQGSMLQQDLLEMLSEAAGWYAIPFHKDQMSDGWGNEPPIGPEFATTATSNFLIVRSITIAGGASEVQRNMIAKSLLG
jgi:alkylation response protein AidB-like acyl-CoA dehydrogenase